MTIEHNPMVIVSEGDMQVRMGKALTTFAHKGQDKFVLRANEIPTLIKMLEEAKKSLDTTQTVS